MPHFEIFIPAPQADGYDVTARLTAPSWTEALRTGLARVGDTADVRHVMCDIRDDGIDVTEPKSGRVFKIRETAAAYAAPSPSPSPSPVPVPVPSAAQAALIAAAPVDSGYVATVAPTPAIADASELPIRKPLIPHGDRAVKRKSPPPAKAAAPAPAPAPRTPQPVSSRVEDLLADMFVAAAQIYQHKTVKAAADFMLDLAMKAVPAEAGSVLVSSINDTDLYFAAARGPKSNDVMTVRVPMGKGIVGLAAQEGVAIAVSDKERDPSFVSEMSERAGYEARSVVCSPAQRDGRVYGALQLINKKDGATFTSDEMSILDYLASQFAEYVITTGQTGV